MKLFLALMMTLLPLPALACMESGEAREQRYRKADLNRDGYIDAQEFISLGQNNFDGQLSFVDKDHDGRMSREEFLTLAFTKSRCGGG